MKTKCTLGIAVLMSLLIGSTAVFAGAFGYHYGGGAHYRFNGGHHYRYGGSPPYRYGGGYPYRHHAPYYRHGYYGYRYSPEYRNYYYGGDVFLGTLFGFTLGALLAPPAPVYVYREYPPAVVQKEYVYLPSPGQSRQPETPPSESRAAAEPPCLQTREYTTNIVIEGKEFEAHGTKCLRPDGTWSYGPVTPVPSR